MAAKRSLLYRCCLKKMEYQGYGDSTFIYLVQLCACFHCINILLNKSFSVFEYLSCLYEIIVVLCHNSRGHYSK